MSTFVIVAWTCAVVAAFLSLWLSIRRATRMYRAQDALHVKLRADVDATMGPLRKRLEGLLKELSVNEQAQKDPSVRHEFVDVFREVIEQLPEDKRNTLRVLQEQPFAQQVRLAQRFVA